MAITKGKDYDSTPAFGEGRKSLPKGGYVCRIIKVEEIADRNGNPMLHVAFDIDHGEYKNYFTELFQSRKQNARDKFKEVKWPFEGQAWIQVNDWEDKTKTSRKFKGFCTALEDSGTKIWSDNGQLMLDAMKQQYIGVVFQNQENEFEGNRYWRAVPWGFRNVDAIMDGEYFVPEDKHLPTPEPMPSAPSVAEGIPGFEDVADDCPFN